MSPFIPAPPVIPISVIVHENPTQAPITLTEPHPLYNLFYTLAATLIFTASVLRELTLVSFDNDDEGDDWDLVDRRSREIREYLMLHFPVIKFVGDVHSDINKNPDGDETPFQSEILQDRRQIRHTIFVDVALYIALNRALTGGNSESPPYDDPSYRPLLTFFLHVCLLHELGHIIRSVFASKPSPSKDDLHDAPSQKQKQVRKGQVGFDVERGVLGGRVVLGYATNPPPVRQWENVKVVGFRKLDGQTHYLSCAQHEHRLWTFFKRAEIDRISDRLETLPTENTVTNFPLHVVPRSCSADCTSTSASGDHARGVCGTRVEAENESIVVDPVEPPTPSPGISPTSSTPELPSWASKCIVSTSGRKILVYDRTKFSDVIYD